MATAFEKTKNVLEKMTPSLTYDGKDFFLWQKNAKKKLAEILGIDKFCKVETEKTVESDIVSDGVRKIEFSFNTEKYYRANAKIYIPQKIKNAPVIIMLPPHNPGESPAVTWWNTKLLYGAVVGDDTAENLCMRAVKEGFTAISLDVRDQCFEATMINHLMLRTTQGERVWDIMCLLDILQKDYSDVINTEMIGCLGEGNSGITPVYLGALEERIKFVVASNAVSSFRELGQMRNRFCACLFVPNIMKYFEMDDVVKIAYPKTYVQANSIGDVRFDINDTKEVFEKVKSFYKDMGEENKCRYISVDGKRKFHADEVWEAVNEMIR